LKGARAQRTPATSRLIDDWVSAGLLDAPKKVGLGRGKGTEATWPDTQRKLFLALLRKRKEGARRQATLCNVPVFIWLYWGSEYVPTRQVRRALRTWSGAYRTASRRRALHSARLVAEQFDSSQTEPGDRTALIEAIVEVGTKGQITNDKERMELGRAFRRVFDPWGERGEVGPPELQLKAGAWVMLVEARFAAISHYEELTHEDFERARAIHVSAVESYLATWPKIAKHPDVRALFAEPNLDEFANDACQHLLTVLGMEVLRKQRQAATG